jgi:hypothetical protein
VATLLARCELLISADTGAAHLAAAVGTTVLGLYGATAWFAETAPYGDHHLILQTPLNAPLSAISTDAVIAAAFNRLGCLSDSDLCRELQRRNQSGWETSVLPPMVPTDRHSEDVDDRDVLGGLIYRLVDRDSVIPGDSVSQALRQSFAREFLIPAITSEPSQSRCSVSRSADALAQILDYMQMTANLCADSVQSFGTSTGRRFVATQTAASDLIGALEKLRVLATDPPWRPLCPVIHNLDWQLRMLPRQLLPAATFRAHARAYASAARILSGCERKSGSQW